LAWLSLTFGEPRTIDGRDGNSSGWVVDMNNIHASHLVLGRGGASWLDDASAPALHAAGLSGRGQVVGLGDTGVDVRSCAFAGATDVAFDEVSGSHRKVAAYFTLHGDHSDGPDGHGTHIAGSMVSDATGGSGIAPNARVAVVDLEDSRRPGFYDVPDHNIGSAYFDLLRHAGAFVACSPWSYERHDSLETSIDAYVWRHREFLPVFPSGNTFGHAEKVPHAPCGAKNVLCVGASHNARQAYVSKPSFVHSTMRILHGSCASLETGTSCASEVQALPAFFGATAPVELAECQAVASLCLDTGSACPECAFPASALNIVSDALTSWAWPRDACTALQQSFPRDSVCLVERGGCSFITKAANCASAGW